MMQNKNIFYIFFTYQNLFSRVCVGIWNNAEIIAINDERHLAMFKVTLNYNWNNTVTAI